MADPRFPYVQWRNGRPRAKHSQWQRKRGFVDEDLKNPDGTWFTMEQAGAFSDRRVAEVKASRGASPAVARLQAIAAAAPRRQNTVADLLRDWKAAWPASMKRKTRKSYDKMISALLWQPETQAQRRARKAAELQGLRVERYPEPLASMLPAALGKPEWRGLHDHMTKARGLRMAGHMIATLSAAWTWGTESTVWRLGPNPRLDMEFEQPDGRVVQVLIPEFMAMVAAADAVGRASIGDCFYLGLLTGQRQTDRLIMKDESEVEGRHAFRQSKTGQLVDIKEAPQLATRLDQARARVNAIKLRLGLKLRPAEIVINEGTGKPYAEKTYGNWVTKIRWLAIFGLPDKLTPEAGLLRADEAAAQLRQTWRQITTEIPFDPAAEPELRAAVCDRRREALAEWFAAHQVRTGIMSYKVAPCPSLAFVNDRGELDFKRDQDLRDTCVMLLDRAGCDLLTICDITGHSYAAAQTIVKHYRARNPERADLGIDRLVLQVRKEGMAG